MVEPRSIGVFVVSFLTIFACMTLGSIRKHEFGPIPMTSPQKTYPDDPFSDSSNDEPTDPTKPELVKIVCTTIDPDQIQVHRHGWPWTIVEYDAPFEAYYQGGLFALHHWSGWRIHWLQVAGSLGFFFVVSWLASIGVWSVLKARITLQSLLAITCIIAFELSSREPFNVPEGIHPFVSSVENVAAGLGTWVSTLACYWSVFVAFHMKLVYRESQRVLQSLSTMRGSRALDQST